MGGQRDEGDFDSEDDSFLREIAHMSDKAPPAPEPNRIGQQLGHFVIRSKLGQGGMGIVYAAEDPRLRRDVALKVLPMALVADPQRRARFLREARSASAVLHPNVATVFDVGEAEGTVFLAMEHVDGCTLRQLMIERGDRLDVREAVRIAREIARGLAAAHRRGVVHRDLKPENVMIDAEGNVKILDFGLAKLASASTPRKEGHRDTDDQLLSRAGSVLGTPGYMSPEQAIGETVDARTDVFSFGVVLHEMLAGARPFTRSTSGAQPSGDSRAPRLSAPHGIPRVVARACLRCLEVLPERRFADGGAVLEELDRIHRKLRSRSQPARRWLLMGGAVAAAALGALWLASSTDDALRLEPALHPAPVSVHSAAEPAAASAVAVPTPSEADDSADPSSPSATALPTAALQNPPAPVPKAARRAPPAASPPRGAPDPLAHQK